MITTAMDGSWFAEQLGMTRLAGAWNIANHCTVYRYRDVDMSVDECLGVLTLMEIEAANEREMKGIVANLGYTMTGMRVSRDFKSLLEHIH